MKKLLLSFLFFFITFFIYGKNIISIQEVNTSFLKRTKNILKKNPEKTIEKIVNNKMIIKYHLPIELLNKKVRLLVWREYYHDSYPIKFNNTFLTLLFYNTNDIKYSDNLVIIDKYCKKIISYSRNIITKNNFEKSFGNYLLTLFIDIIGYKNVIKYIIQKYYSKIDKKDIKLDTYMKINNRDYSYAINNNPLRIIYLFQKKFKVLKNNFTIEHNIKIRFFEYGNILDLEWKQFAKKI